MIQDNIEKKYVLYVNLHEESKFATLSEAEKAMAEFIQWGAASVEIHEVLVKKSYSQLKQLRNQIDKL